jgi:DtxR family Mn-dependent transcriptional regulator
METWKEFDANEVTHSVVHHLMTIHELGQQYGGWARVSDIARKLGITRGSVSINLRGMKARGLVVDDEHHQVKLSPKGLKLAQGVMAKKAVLRAFLRDVLNLSEEQAEVDSCKIEHLISHSTSEQLLHFMRFLTSEDGAAQGVIERFRRFEDHCPDSKTCSFCKDHCLIEELTLTS